MKGQQENSAQAPMGSGGRHWAGLEVQSSHVPRGIAEHAAVGIWEKQAAEVERIWQEFQRELTKLSSDSALIVAEESGHMIPLEEPESVVDAIR